MATDNKYDRQLRLWGSEGQRLLNTARVCMLGSSGLSSESLKNLVLPGIGFFTIVDDSLVTERDLGENFFVTKSDLGKPRADVVKTYLLELNPDVQGESIIQSIPSTLSNPSFFQAYTLIIACQLPFSEIRTLGAICEQNNIKLIVAKSNGLLGYLRVYCKEHLVIESKPSDKEIYDLRLHEPFPELLAYAESISLDGIQDIYHSHIPFIVLLVKFVKEWTEAHGSKPRNMEEKTKFKDFVKGKSRDFFAQMNFQEAVSKAYLCFLDEGLPSEVIEILNDEKSVNADTNSEDFWICAKAVKEFINKNQTVPLSGIFSDMTSDTNSYITLQNIYKNRADCDYAEVLHNYQRIKGTNQEPEIVKQFCKNLQTLELTRFRSLESEFTSINVESIDEDEYEESKSLEWYLALRALDWFIQDQSREPTQDDKESLIKYTESLGKAVAPEIAEEIIRFCRSELHCISALIGGALSQEAVKLITHQYTPINNTFIYNSVHTTAVVLNL